MIVTGLSAERVKKKAPTAAAAIRAVAPRVAASRRRRRALPGARTWPASAARAASASSPQVWYRSSGDFARPVAEDLVERGGKFGARVGDSRWRFVQVSEDDRELGVPIEGAYTGEAFVEDAAERVLVGARVDRAALDLLGRHVVDRADEATIAGQARDRGHMTREPEVADIGVVARPGGADEDVAGLHVPVHEAGLVGHVERGGDLFDQRDRASRLEPAVRPEKLA